MNKSFTLKLTVILLTGMTGFSLSAQMIWPGDINNNGRVTGMDLLYLGTQYGALGYDRPNASTDWNAQQMGQSWNNTLPGTLTDVAYADANGNGYISQEDIDEGISANFGKTHDPQIPDVFPPIGQENIDSPLALSSPVSEAALGAHLEFDLSLGNEGLPIQNLLGISFKIIYDPTLVEGGLSFERNSDWWIDPTLARSRYLVKDNPDDGVIEISIIRINQNEVDGFGPLGVIAFDLTNNPDLVLPLTLNIEFDDIILIDDDMQPTLLYPVGVALNITSAQTTFNCPNIISPVCGEDGVTYLNGCFAEAAGVTNYSEGVCFSDCIDPNFIDPYADCGDTYDPVCGCNGLTYVNECAAIASGVTSYSSGTCNDNCYDPNYVVTSSGTYVDAETGVISLYCSDDYDPVCGCNGITYDNACIAEASGITFYTQGACDNVCVDPSIMDPDTNCPTVYDPVCGCNDVTYSNACYAEAAGVVSYTSGVCGLTSSWCEEAIPIQCGDFLAYETTIGAGNNINNYPGCSNYSFQGADKVYIINKTTVGDLQIGLEITTPGLDLDLFLLADYCSQVTCLKSSTTDNSVTNNEGILYEDAPLGTYYIVVDGQYASSEGNYRIEVNCGYLYCGDAQPLDCGTAYQGNNMNGNDDVSLYGCDGNVFNVENNGPEIVHFFTTTEAGQVTINMTNLTANLELFLLRSCDRGDCIDYSQNSGTSDESITAWLPAGTYYVVVDGYNGAVGDYTLVVDCNSSCDLDVVSVTSTPASCSQNDGSITIISGGGTPGFIVSYSGPISGSFYTYSNNCTISNLPPGTYFITKTDASGCYVHETITVYSSGNLSLTLNPTNASCGSDGSLWVTVNGGTAPFNVWISGPVNADLTTNYASFDIQNLPPGNYTIYITDQTGCSVSQQFVIAQDGGDFYFDGTPYPGACGELGYIHIITHYGIPPYNIQVSGPVSGYNSTNSPIFNIINLPPGTYTVTLEDGNWCTHTEVIVIENLNLDITATSINAACGQAGGILVNMSNGTGPYTITWNGPTNGSDNTNNDSYTINNLPSGTYQIIVEDANWCSDYVVVQVNTSGGQLSFNVIPLDGTCSALGALWIDINDGTPPYTVNWWGPSSGSDLIYGDGFDIPNLTEGCYTVQITDANGCSNTEIACIELAGNLDVDLTGINGSCGQSGSIDVLINGGSPIYQISWTGSVNGSVSVNSNIYTIANLPSGTYAVYVTDANGCTDYAVVQIDNAAGGQLTLNAISLNGDCNQLGGIWLDIIGGSAPYIVSWNGPVSGSTTIYTNGLAINDLPAGTYWLTVTDANGCNGTTEVTVIQDNTVEISLSGTNAGCGTDGSIYVYISNGTGPFTITWNGPSSGSTTTNQTTYNIPNLPAGNYSIWVTDANGCSVDNNISILYTDNIDITAVPTNGECGSTGSIHVGIDGGTPIFTISWSGSVSGTVTTTNSFYEITDLPSGAYYITVVDANGCFDTYTVTLDNDSSSLSIQTTLVVNACGQYNWIWIDITGGWPTYTITWIGPQNGSGTTDGNGFEIIDLPPGTYTVTVTDIHGCVTYAVVIVYDAPIELLNVTGVDGNCGNYGSIIATVSNGTPEYVFTWTGPVSGSVTTNDSTYVIDNLPSGTYTVTLLDGNWCTDTEVVTINNTPSDLDIATTLVVNDCGQYNWIWIDIIGGWPTYTITWIGPQNGSDTTDENGFEIIDLPPGTYTVTVTDIHGCSVSVVVIIYDAPIELLTLTTSNGDCNNYGSITAAVIGGLPVYQISWTGPVSGSVATNDSIYVIDNLPSGTYTVSLLDGNWCTDVEVITINNTGGNLTVVAVAVNGSCEQNGSIWLDIYDGTAPYTITWTGPESGSVVTDASGYSIPNLPEGTYTVTVVDANGCTDTTIVYVTVSANDLDAIAVPFDGDCDQDGYIHVGIVGGDANYIVSWVGPVSGGVVVPGPSYNILDLPAGTYTVTVTDSNGCTDIEIITINSLNTGLDVSTMVSNGYCGGLGNIWMDFYNGAAPFTITWTGPVSGSDVTSYYYYDIINLPTGTYTVTITDANGCAFTGVYTIINVIDDLTASLTAIQGGCGVPGSIQIDIMGGTPAYTISWTGNNANGSTTTSNTTYFIQNLPSGIYTVSIEDANGCGEILSIQLLNYPNNLQVYTTPVQPTCTQLGAIGLIINGGAADYIISWTGPVSGTETNSSGNYIIGNLPGGDYTININDANDCYAILNVSLDATTDTPMVDFSFQVSSLSVSFTNLSADGNYLWTFGDGTSSTENNPTHEYPASGSYEVCLTITNSCGTATFCQTIGVASGLDAVILYLGQAYGGSGTMVSVPVTIQNCDLLVSLAGTIQVDESTVATIMNVSPGMISPTFNSDNNTFLFYDNTGEGIALTDGDILFYLNIQLTGNIGSESGLHLINNPLAVEVGGIVNDTPMVLPHITVPGNVEIMDTGVVEGFISTFWGAGIEDAQVLVSGTGMNETDMTDENGVYTLTGLPVGQQYTFQAEKDNAPENGLSTYALFIGQRFILGMEPPQITSPYQVIAGDANCNNSFTTLDLFIIQQLIIGATDEFANCPSWVFVAEGNDMPQDFTAQNVFPYTAETSMMVMYDTIANFVGVKIGDILGQVDPNGFQEEDFDDRNENELVFTTDNRQIQAGEYVDIPVSSNNFKNIVSYQMGLAIDESKLNFVEFIPGDANNITGSAAAFKEGQLRISWFNSQGISSSVSSGEILFTIRLLALDNIDNLSNLIAASNHAITSEAHTDAGEALDVIFQFNGVTSTIDPQIHSFKLYQNEPNPFTDKTTIRFILPYAMDAELTIHDSFGRTVRQFNGSFGKGENRVNIDDLTLDAGVYFYTLKAGSFAETRSMVILK